MNEDTTVRTAMPKRVGRTLYLIGLIILSFNYHVAVAGPLDLDETFNGTGKVVTPFQSVQFVEAKAVAFQQDGKIIAVGFASYLNGTGMDFALVRYKLDGSIDQAFGTLGNGRVITDFNSTRDRVAGVVVQTDDKIVVAGTVCNLAGPPNCDFALARYHPNGAPDESFGTMGLVREIVGATQVAHGVALQQDGKIVVAGQQTNDLDYSDFLIARYLPNGAPDTSFGDAGKVVTSFGYWDIAWAVAIQNDSKIVAVGESTPPMGSPTYGALARYNADGTLDSSFNGMGIYGPYFCLVLQIPSCGKIKVGLGGGTYDYPVSVALRKADGTEDGKIVVAGGFGLARFNADGSLDMDFGNAGITDIQVHGASAVAILGNGHIVVAGSTSNDFGLSIFEPTGQPCAGAGSSVTTDFNGSFDTASGMAVQSDGKVVVVGSAWMGTTGSDFALARYKGGDCPFQFQWLGNYISSQVSEVFPPCIAWDCCPWCPGILGQLAIPASDGGAFAGPNPSGYQAFKLANAGGEGRQKGSLVAVANALGDSLLELLEAQQLLVPTDIAAERAGGGTASGSRWAPSLRCYRVKMHSSGRAQRERKPFTITDTLKRTWTLDVGEPESLCKPIDRRGRERTGPAPSLVGYRVKDIKMPGTYPRLVRLPTANEFGARVLQVEQPELLFIPSRAQ
jgi:uncharacterized delta-60 repeat protein